MPRLAYQGRLLVDSAGSLDGRQPLLGHPATLIVGRRGGTLAALRVILIGRAAQGRISALGSPGTALVVVVVARIVVAYLRDQACLLLKSIILTLLEDREVLVCIIVVVLNLNCAQKRALVALIGVNDCISLRRFGEAGELGRSQQIFEQWRLPVRQGVRVDLRVLLEGDAQSTGILLLIDTIIRLLFDGGPIHKSSISGLPSGCWNLIIVVIVLLFLTKFLHSQKSFLLLSLSQLLCLLCLQLFLLFLLLFPFSL